MTDWVGAGAALAAVTAAVVGGALAVRQLRVSARANVSGAYAQVSQGMAHVTELLFQNHEWIPYFYDGEEPDGDDDKWKLQLICEAIVDFADSLVEQRRAVPEADMDWSTWESYFRYLHQNSPLLGRYLEENLDFYPDYVFSVFGLIVVRDQSGKQTSRWEAKEVDAEELEQFDWLDGAFGGGGRPSGFGVRGYPWIRTWQLTRIDDGSGDPPTLIAAVVPAEGEARIVDVYLAWHGSPPSGAEPVLRSWVLGLLTSSTRLRKAVFHASDGTTSVERLKTGGHVGLPPWRRGRHERFVVPTLSRTGEIR